MMTETKGFILLTLTPQAGGDYRTAGTATCSTTVDGPGTDSPPWAAATAVGFIGFFLPAISFISPFEFAMNDRPPGRTSQASTYSTANSADSTTRRTASCPWTCTACPNAQTAAAADNDATLG